MASTHPADFLGLGHDLGRIAPGYRASLVLLDDAFEVAETWIDGVPEGRLLAAHRIELRRMIRGVSQLDRLFAGELLRRFGGGCRRSV